MTDTPEELRYYGPRGSVSRMKPEIPKIPEQKPKPDMNVRLKLALTALRSAAKEVLTANRTEG